LREAHELNHDGSARGPVGGVSNRRTAPKRKYWRMFGITGGRERRCRQAKRGGGKLRFWGVAPHTGHVSNFRGLKRPRSNRLNPFRLRRLTGFRGTCPDWVGRPDANRTCGQPAAFGLTATTTSRRLRARSSLGSTLWLKSTGGCWSG
jgi:hypothetical protein